MDPGLEGLAHELGVLAHRQDHDLRLRGALTDPRNRGEARLVREVEVEHEYVGTVGAGISGGRLGVTPLRHDLESLFQLEQHAQRRADDRMVLDEDD